MKALPAAMATGCIHSGTMAGKLNGVMPATTPRGWRRLCTSTPVEASALNSLLDAWLMPQTNSIVSRPRDPVQGRLSGDLVLGAGWSRSGSWLGDRGPP
jgi:hypothetical protein